MTDLKPAPETTCISTVFHQIVPNAVSL